MNRIKKRDKTKAMGIVLMAFLFLLLSLKGLAQERWLFLGNSITQAGHYVDYIETWFLLNEVHPPEIIDLGLSSETVSGLSEADHPFPRPCLFTRLEKVLARTEPDLVVACYGMNCGIYFPFSEDRFLAYQEGIKELITRVHASGAEIILLTPPPYAGRVKPKTPPGEGETYGYSRPASDYNKTLARYAEWILSLDAKEGVRALDIRSGLEAFMEKSYPLEPVHPSPFGHKLMAEDFLRGIGKSSASDLLVTGNDPRVQDLQWTKLLELVRQQREIYDRALLNDIGHGNPGVMERFPMPLTEAEKLVVPVNQAIDSLVELNEVKFGAYALPENLQKPPAGAWGFPDRSPDLDVLPGFIDPPEGYGPVPFHWWVGEELTRERLLWQLEELDKAGTQGLCVSYPHSHVLSDPELNAEGHGMFGMTYPSEPAFFSDSWWELWNWFTGECADRSMGLGLDDYTFVSPGNKRWPDEIAALPEMKNYKGKLLFHQADTVLAGEQINLQINDSILSLSAIPLDPSTDEGVWPIDLLKLSGGNSGLTWTAPDEMPCLVVRVDLGENFMLHPRHGQELIKHYFQKFEDHIDEENHQGMNYFFQDELHVDLGWDSWSEDFAEQFIRHKGYDIRPNLAALNYDLGPRTPKIRLDYADVVSLLAEERYFAPIFRWHWERGKTFGCDNWGRGLNPVAYGDYFRATRWFGAPGNDAPRGATALVQTKVSSSISHLYDRPRVWLEAFHSMGWGASPEMFTEATDRHYLLGGNLLCLHGLYYTTLGGWWEWAPPDFHFRMPYWPHLKSWLRSMERQSYLLSQGQHVCDVAILYPASTMHADPSKAAMEFHAAHELYEAGIDFDFIDYQSLARAKIKDGQLHVSGESYKALVLDDMESLRFASLQKAQELYRDGGMVVGLKALPRASDRVGRNDPLMETMVKEIFGVTAQEASQVDRMKVFTHKNGGTGIFSPEHSGLGTWIRDRMTLDFVPAEGTGHVQHRRMGERDVYMVMDVPRGTECFFRSHGQVELWDVGSGEIEHLPVTRVSEKGTFLRMPVDPPRSCFIVFSPGTPEMEEADPASPEVKETFTFSGPWECNFVPTLDNRWGDFRLPATHELIGPEARELSYAPEDQAESGWQESGFENSGWDLVTCDFGPRMWKLYIPDTVETDAVLRAVLKQGFLSGDLQMKEQVYTWKPYEFSWRWGVENEPGSQGYHGLKGKISDHFLIMEQQGSYLFSSSVHVKKEGTYSFIREGLAPGGIWVDGKKVKKDPKKLKAGSHKVLVRYDNPLSMEAPSGRHPIDLRTRSALVLCEKGGEDLEKQPLAMKWYNREGLLEYDLFGGQANKGCYRFLAPPGLKQLSFRAFGKVEIWWEGEKLELQKTGRREDKSSHYLVEIPSPKLRASYIAIRIRPEPGYYAGAAFPEPIKLSCGPGQIQEGDWSQLGVLKHYSGGISYSRTFSLDQAQISSSALLDLGRVGATSEVSINGKQVGIEIAPPYHFDIGDFLKAGENRIEILVYNTLSNHYQSLPTPSDYKEPVASGLLGPVSIAFY